MAKQIKVVAFLKDADKPAKSGQMRGKIRRDRLHVRVAEKGEDAATLKVSDVPERGQFVLDKLLAGKEAVVNKREKEDGSTVYQTLVRMLGVTKPEPVAAAAGKESVDKRIPAGEKTFDELVEIVRHVASHEDLADFVDSL